MFGRGPETRKFRLVTKLGTPLLLLPIQSNIAARTLELYPAQTRLARGFRALLRFTLRNHLPSPAKTVGLPYSASAPIPDFIHRHAGGDRDFGILLGNANAPGRRWIMMIFDSDGQPWRILKVGVSLRARELVRAEASILAKLRVTAGCFPILYDTLDSQISVISTDYLPGSSPQDATLIAPTLSSWLRSGECRTIIQFRAWQCVRDSDAPQKIVAAVKNALLSTRLTTALSHGDFAPWNIREHAGKWAVLDWERGEENGMPGWDWLHFHIQSDVLVQKKNAQQVFNRTIRMMQSQAFEKYAAAAGFSGKADSILLSYLLHAIYVNRQTEGADTLKKLLSIALDHF